MKGVINQGGVKDASASLLRAFSGAPRCQPVGSTDIIYNFDITYSAGQITFDAASGAGSINAANGLPFGTWVLDCTLSVTKPVSSPDGTTMQFGLAQLISGVPRSPSPDRFLLNPRSWDQIVLHGEPFFTGPILATANHNWTLNGPVEINPVFLFVGPELLGIFSGDLGTDGTSTNRLILPEQSEHCQYAFYIYMLTPMFSFNSASKNAWTSFGDARNSIGRLGWILQGLDAGLYPSNTVIGTLQFRFRRIQNVPLFNFSLTPPLTANFTNRSFYNTSLIPVWDWDFGDGSGHSSAKDPGSHAYSAPGRYIVKLTATDAAGQAKEFDQVIDIRLTANFTFTKAFFNVSGQRVCQVVFKDASIGIEMTWHWDFGDGVSGDGFGANPFHNYIPAGPTFSVTLIIGDGFGNTSTITKVIDTSN